MTVFRCACTCHVAPDIYPHPYGSVDTADVIEAAVACAWCADRHCRALLATELPNHVPEATAGRGIIVTTPEGRKLAWEEYERELKNRPKPTDGGGMSGV